jgi:plastocyanin domain-containing protein
MNRTWIPIALLAFAAAAGGCTGAQSDKTESASGTGPAQRHAITVDGTGFHPSEIELAAGRPATLVLTRTTDETCAKEIVIPSLDIRRELPLGTPVEVVLTPKDKGEVRFACGMDMLTGVLHVQ